MDMLKRKAFFDLDGTIIKETSGIELARILTQLEEDRSKWKEFWENQRLFKVPRNYDHAIQKLSEDFAKGVKNTDIGAVQYAVERLRERINIREGFSELYSWLVKNGFETFVLTASPVEVFGAIPAFSFTETYGLILEKNEKYTGRCVCPMTTRTKEAIISNRVAGASFSFGVSDTFEDIKAYRKLDMKFLLNNSARRRVSHINVTDFLQIKKLIETHLGSIMK
jgi:phosphoserine phosphatase